MHMSANPAGDLPPLAVSKREAARLLNVSERTLDRLGIPHVKLQQKILYRTETLAAWLREQEQRQSADGGTP